jgi:hypothetical protein
MGIDEVGYPGEVEVLVLGRWGQPVPTVGQGDKVYFPVRLPVLS